MVRPRQHFDDTVLGNKLRFAWCGDLPAGEPFDLRCMGLLRADGSVFREKVTEPMHYDGHGTWTLTYEMVEW